MIVWVSVVLRRTFCGDIEGVSLEEVSDDDFRSGCGNVSKSHHKQSFSGLHSSRRSYFTDFGNQGDSKLGSDMLFAVSSLSS